ncbi:MAG: sirohydrochlorin cobaltochelatase [Acidimicrobiia bacterium]|nr:sirohydrochlorin cobaltochelatase [Acidimicrobiia bacterium]
MKTQALLLVDHGSTQSEANELLPRIAQLVKELSKFEIVCYAHMELAEPTIEQGFDFCVAAGASEIIVHPYFLAPGRHSTSDIPRLAARAASKHDGVRYRVTEPLGLDTKIAQLVIERVEQSASRKENPALSEA